MNRKYIILGVTIAAILLLVGGYFLFAPQSSPTDRENISSDGVEQDKVDPSVAPAGEAGLPTKDNEESPDSGESGGGEANTENTSKAEITKAVQDSAGNLYISVEVSGVTAGECTLNLTKGSTSINRTSDIYYSPNNPSVECSDFRIEADKLSTGVWNIKVSVDSPQAEVAPAEDQVNVAL